VSKRRGSRYARGRSGNWLKVKKPGRAGGAARGRGGLGAVSMTRDFISEDDLDPRPSLARLSSRSRLRGQFRCHGTDYDIDRLLAQIGKLPKHFRKFRGFWQRLWKGQTYPGAMRCLGSRLLFFKRRNEIRKLLAC
jgi:hypothetical protein